MKIFYKELTNATEDNNALVNFLRKVDNDFRVPLSSKCSLDLYAHKIIENGHVICYFDEDDKSIISAIGFYCNDVIQGKAYISIMCSLPEARGFGFAKKLLSKTSRICQINNMNEIIAYSVNPIAIHLYKSVGYEEISSSDENSLSTVKLSYKVLK